MVRRRRHSDRRFDLRLPRSLAERVTGLYRTPVSVTPDVDEKIMETVWEHCEAVKARRRVRLWGQVGVTIAAVFLVVWFYDMMRGPVVPPNAPAPLAGVEDIDRSGTIDILDALALARHIGQGGRLGPRWDVSRDGVVDQTDVDAVAIAAVGITEQTHRSEPAQDTSQGTARYAVVDIYIDTGDEALGAYQVELSAQKNAMKIVSVEGGEPAAFAGVPYHDTAALGGDRIIIAAIHAGNKPPNGKAMVARVHVRIGGREEPQYNVQLHVAATADGEKIHQAAVQFRRS